VIVSPGDTAGFEPRRVGGVFAPMNSSPKFCYHACVTRLVRKFKRTTRAISKICLAVAATLLALGLAEAGLRLELSHLPLPLADALDTGYVDFGNGIYRFDPALNMERMRPHYRREMFFNGYFWLHQTDWMGFRNPTDRDHDDIVLIGDSMIYGHGLAETSTVRSHLEHVLRRPVASLGIQGGAMDMEYEILRHDAVRLSPQWVFIFFLNNDITDVESRLSDDEMRRFLALPVEDHSTRYFKLRPHPDHRRGNFDWHNLYVVRSYEFLQDLLKSKLRHQPRTDSLNTAAHSATHGSIPVSAPGRDASTTIQPDWVAQAPFAGNPRMQLALRFHLRAILKADDFARRHHFHFAYVFIAVPMPYDGLYERLIADYCGRYGVEFFSLRQSYDDARRAGVQLYLAHDGHLSDAGARITAQALANHFDLHSGLSACPSANQ
jgi:hypothetical protein